MRIELSKTGGFTVIRPDGSTLEPEDGWRLEEEIIRVLDSGHHVILDLSACAFLNSVGLGGLVRAYTRAGVIRKIFRLCCLGNGVRRLLDITKLDSIFETYDTVAEAVVGPVTEEN
ncbi:MAG: STAS domain-containing protein [Candidatus Saccharibacteria bacterium]